MADRKPKIRIFKAEPEHLQRVVGLMRELAEFEELLEEFVVSEELLQQYLFGEKAMAELILGCIEDKISAYALFFHNFSTFRGCPGMYLEDLYVQPTARGYGLGKKLLLEVARLAKERACPRLEWAVLNWNEHAKTFYESLGAKPLDDWTLYRMDQSAIDKLLLECI